MIEFPTYEKKAKIRDLEFIIRDLSIKFFDLVEKNPDHYNDLEVLKDGSNLTDDEILALGDREKIAIIEEILTLTNPTRENQKDSEDESGKK